MYSCAWGSVDSAKLKVFYSGLLPINLITTDKTVACMLCDLTMNRKGLKS